MRVTVWGHPGSGGAPAQPGHERHQRNSPWSRLGIGHFAEIQGPRKQQWRRTTPPCVRPPRTSRLALGVPHQASCLSQTHKMQCGVTSSWPGGTLPLGCSLRNDPSSAVAAALSCCKMCLRSWLLHRCWPCTTAHTSRPQPRLATSCSCPALGPEWVWGHHRSGLAHPPRHHRLRGPQHTRWPNWLHAG